MPNNDSYFYVFLSHLSGDEDLYKFLADKNNFLSHLSGDEVRNGVGIFCI